MECNKTKAIELVEKYNQRYHTAFEPLSPYHLFPDENGECEFKHQSWPGNERAGVYLILSKDDEVLYVGESNSLGRRFYSYFRDDEGKCIILSDNWSKEPYAIISIPAPDDRRYERLSLEEYLIQNLRPIDNIRGKL